MVLNIPAPPEAKLTPFGNWLFLSDKYGGGVGIPNFSAAKQLKCKKKLKKLMSYFTEKLNK